MKKAVYLVLLSLAWLACAASAEAEGGTFWFTGLSSASSTRFCAASNTRIGART